MKKLIPLEDLVFVVLHRDAPVTPGGIVIPEDARQEKLLGTIVLVGPEVTRVRPGDIALVSNYAGQPVEYGGVTYQVMAQENILAIETEDGLPESTETLDGPA